MYLGGVGVIICDISCVVVPGIVEVSKVSVNSEAVWCGVVVDVSGHVGKAAVRSSGASL